MRWSKCGPHITSGWGWSLERPSDEKLGTFSSLGQRAGGLESKLAKTLEQRDVMSPWAGEHTEVLEGQHTQRGQGCSALHPAYMPSAFLPFVLSSRLVAKSSLTFCSPMDWSPPGSSVHGSFQARRLEWVAISYSRGSSSPRDRTHVSWISCVGRRLLYHRATRLYPL